MKARDVTTPSFYATRPDVLLRLEGVAVLVAVCVAYGSFYAGRWGVFALLFLAPDVSLLCYALPSKRAFTAIYNVAHSDLLPVVLGLLSWGFGWNFAGQLALIWLAHISFDRLLGYGLKYPGNFKHTHIQNASSLQVGE